MWAVMAVGIITFLSSCNAGIPITSNSKTDTTVLYKADTLLITGATPVILKCDFSLPSQKLFRNRLKTLLLMENPVLIAAPDGVYELYITNSPDIKSISSSNEGFVTVLDLYGLTAPAAKNRIEVDVSEQLKNFFLLKQPISSFFICIRFGPTKLPDGSYSSKTGELRLSGIGIVQTVY